MASTLSLGKHAAAVFLAVLLLGSCALLRGNDAVIEFAAGGIQLRHETLISMEEERLTISRERVSHHKRHLRRSLISGSAKVQRPCRC
jgi:hypothetical protein